MDIQSPTAEIRRGIKKKKKIESTGQNIMSASATQGGHKNQFADLMSHCPSGKLLKILSMPCL